VGSPRVAARLGYIALYAAVGASFPFLAVFYESRGLSVGTIGVLIALAAVAGLVAAPLWGILADRVAGSRSILPFAAVIAATGAVALVLAEGPLPITLAVLLMALAFAGLGPTLDAAALATLAGDRDRWGGYRALGSASFIVAVVATGALIERAGAPSMFAVYIAALAVLAVVTLPLRGTADAARLPGLHGLGLVLRHPDLARFLPAVLVVFTASMSVNWYFSIHLLDLGAPGELVGSAWAIGALVEIPIMWSYPWLTARLGAERLLIVGAAAFAARVLVLVVTSDPLLATASMALHGIGFALVLVGGVTYVARHAPPATAATAQGVLSATVFSVAQILGPATGSWVAASAGVATMFLASLALSVVAIPALLLATRPRLAGEASAA
jgi:MFS transporter, PPP family, 3-phenylpropionic acid transporter